jgi:hypothetical protein
LLLVTSLKLGLLALLENNLVLESSKVLDLNLNHISVLEPVVGVSASSNTKGSAGEDQVSGHEGGALGVEGNNISNLVDHISGVSVLDNLAVNLGGQLEVVGIASELGRHNGRAKRSPSVVHLSERELSSSSLSLPGSLGQIVTARVSENVVESLLLVDVSASLTNDNNKLTLVVSGISGLGDSRNNNVLSRSVKSSDGLKEENRVLGSRKTKLIGVLTVVHTNKSNGSGVSIVKRRKQLGNANLGIGDGVGAEDVTANEVGLSGKSGILDTGGQNGVSKVDLGVGSQKSNQSLG